MKSKLATGITGHDRYFPETHSFSYPISLYCFDLDELELVDRTIPFLSVDSFNLLSIWQKDYGDWSTGTIKEKITARCKREDPAFEAGSIQLITMPKTLGWVFNSVSFYLCHDTAGALCYFVLEINNTFFERCQYVLPVAEAKSIGNSLQWKLQKEFHVSPFYSMDYDYCITLARSEAAMRVDILMLKAGKTAFCAYAAVTFEAMASSTSLVATVHRATRMALSMPRITYQAFKLSFLRRLPVLQKPNPFSRVIVRAEPIAWFDQFCLWIGRKHLQKLKIHRLVLRLPDGRCEAYGDPDGKEVELRICNFAFFRKVLLQGGVGFGESYTAGDWEADDPAAVVEFFLDNYSYLQEEKIPFTSFFQRFNTVLHWLNRNSLHGSKRNIQAHYDLNNDFFKLFLDESMVYSAGIYSSDQDSLEDAQRLKLDTIARKAALQPGMSILEIGSGWGALAEHCARSYDCSVTSLTLSEEQKKYAEEHARSRGLSGTISYVLQDYRNTSGTFDRIVSVEMLEAVGKDNLEEFFTICNSRLNPEGVLVVQVISFPDTHYRDYCKRSDWIQKHIFPGSHLPSLSVLLESAARASFIVDSVENYPLDYAQTLREWRRRFDAHEADVRRLGFNDEFIRKWRFYLASCEAEFNSRWLSVYQVVFTRPNNRTTFRTAVAAECQEEVA